MMMKNSRTFIVTFYVFLILSVLLGLPSCNKQGKDKTHDMSSMDTEKKEGHMEGMDMSDPATKMDMKKSDNPFSGFNDSLGLEKIVIPDNYQVISSQQTVKPVANIANNEIVVQGYIALDERRNVKVPARIAGRIEKLYLKYNLQYVKKGEIIMQLYSPELNTYQEELLFLIKNGSDSLLVLKAQEKLRLLGVTQDQINKVQKTGKAFFTVNVYSPKSGYVFFNSTNQKGNSMGDDPAKEVSGSNMNGMGGNDTKINVSSGNNQIREGNYVNKGEVLFLINDLEKVWVMMAVDNSHQHILKTGLEVLLISELYKKDTLHERINFIEPVYENNQKFIMSRIYLNNPHKKYKINSLLDIIITTIPATPIMIPYSSVLFLGKRKIVWVLKEENGASRIFEARDITIGITHSEMVEVRSGLKISEEIALNAGYLLDRESLVKPE